MRYGVACVLQGWRLRIPYGGGNIVVMNCHSCQVFRGGMVNFTVALE